MPTPLTRANSAAPAVAVLLATHNGLRWLPEQLESIFAQRGVSVRVIALDDESTDGTREWLEERAGAEARLTLLPRQGASGSAAANFYRLIEQAELRADEFVAFADQDDLWLQGKLERHASILSSGTIDGVSSDVTAVLPDGRRVLIRKSFPQRTFDYLLESPGPGSTFMLSPRLLQRTKHVLLSPSPDAHAIDYHDWLIYVVARASGWSWQIDSIPSVDYRQHDSNAMGANVGLTSATGRLALMRERWHRNQATLLAEVGLSVAEAELEPQLREMHSLLSRPGMRARLSLARRAHQLRRRVRDQLIIGLLITAGAW